MDVVPSSSPMGTGKSVLLLFGDTGYVAHAITLPLDLDDLIWSTKGEAVGTGNRSCHCSHVSQLAAIAVRN